MPNLYAIPTDVTARRPSAVGSETLLLDMLEAASRQIDSWTGRHFYSWSGFRTIDIKSQVKVRLPEDLLSASALGADSELDQTWDGEAWVEGTDYYLDPDTRFPKQFIILLELGNYSPATAERYLKLTGVWGYGDGESASSWTATAITGAVTTADGTALTLGTASGVAAGQTILVEAEQMYVSAVVTTTATVQRGVNGTTAAIHTANVISTAKYPRRIIKAAIELAILEWNDRQGESALQAERIGDYSRSRWPAKQMEEVMVQHLFEFRR